MLRSSLNQGGWTLKTSVPSISRIVLTLALASIAALSVAGCSRRSRPPNVILLVIDCLRADHLGAYGYALGTSPNIDRFASNAVVFERAITQGGWTRPAIGSLFTSLYPHVHGATRPGRHLPEDALTLAEALQQRGYLTIGFQTNPVIGGSQNFAQGFDRYDERIGARGAIITNSFLRWLSRNAGSRFFAYLHFMDTHLPYQPPEAHRLKFERAYSGPFATDKIRSRGQVLDLLPTMTAVDKRHVIAMYDGAIAYVDEQVGRLLGALTRLGLNERTIVVITSDHGEELFDRGGFEHGHSLQKEIVRVPLIMGSSRPGGQPVRVRQLVRHIDVYPTIMARLGIDPPSSLMGRDLGPSIVNPDLDWLLPGVTESVMYGPPQVSLEQGTMKLIVMEPAVRSHHARQLRAFPALRDFAESGRTVFYDLARDPGEREHLVTHPLLARFVSRLEEQRTRRVARVLDEDAEVLDEEELEAFRSLGYIK